LFTLYPVFLVVFSKSRYLICYTALKKEFCRTAEKQCPSLDVFKGFVQKRNINKKSSLGFEKLTEELGESIF